MSGRLAGKVAIVTGSGAGIGQGCALMFARQGARVVGCDIDAAAAEATVALLKKEGLSLDSVHPCDLTSATDVERLVSFALDRHQGLDILVNAGAWGAFAPIDEMDYESEWRKIKNEQEQIADAMPEPEQPSPDEPEPDLPDKGKEKPNAK